MWTAGVCTPPGRLFCILMYLLYLDDSGSVRNANDRHIILAGLAVFERTPHWFSSRLDAIADRLCPQDPISLEFRGSDIFGGKKQWRGMQKVPRINALPGISARSATAGVSFTTSQRSRSLQVRRPPVCCSSLTWSPMHCGAITRMVKPHISIWSPIDLTPKGALSTD